MLACALPIILLMLGATILSFLLASMWKQLQVDEIEIENEGLKSTNTKLEQEYNSLIAYSNSLHQEKERLVNTQKELGDKVQSLSTSYKILQRDNTTLTDEFDTFKASVRHSVKDAKATHDKVATVKSLVQENEKLKAQYDKLLASKNQVDKLYLSEKEKNEQLTADQLSTKNSVDENWEKQYKDLKIELIAQKSKVNQLQNAQTTVTTTIDPKEIEKLSSENEALKNEIATIKSSLTDYKSRYQKYVKDYHEMRVKVEQLEEVKSKLQQVEPTTGMAELNMLRTENNTLRLELSAFKSQVASPKSKKNNKRQTDILHRIERRKNRIPFDKIGVSTIEERDNLKRLKGLGPFVEKKMNAIGIFSFHQLVNLNIKDQKQLNELLELPKNKFQKDEWVIQAKKILGIKDSPETILERIKERKSAVNFNRIGIAKTKDELQKINGVGPFIEKKLNAIEIFTFKQIAKFNSKDIAIVNEVIELTPGHIEADMWVKQAKELL